MGLAESVRMCSEHLAGGLSWYRRVRVGGGSWGFVDRVHLLVNNHSEHHCIDHSKYMRLLCYSGRWQMKAVLQQLGQGIVSAAILFNLVPGVLYLWCIPQWPSCIPLPYKIYCQQS